MTFDFAGGRKLLLAGSESTGLWLIAGALALALLLVLYREERRLISRRLGLGLLGLRLLAAAVLVLALFEPIAARTWREAVRGRVLIAVDDSESMATVDRPGGPSRLEIARGLIDGPEAPLSRLAVDHEARGTAFAREARPEGPLPDLVESLRKPLSSGDSARSTTDWGSALALALKMPDDAPTLGLVLLTDGRQNAEGDPSPIVDRLAARGIPVYPVLVGSTQPPPDSAIASIQAPAGINKGESANVSATLKLDGFPGGSEVRVTLDRPGASPMIQGVRVPPDGSRPTATFRVPLDEVGTVPLTVSVEPAPGDARPDNDRKTVAVRVADDKARVLLVDGEARWEFRYLRNALSRDPRVTLDAIVFHQPSSTGSTDLSYDTAWPARADPGSPDPLGRYDAILVGDVDPADLPAEVWARLDAYVAGRGGTLAILPGPRFWPSLAGEGPRALLPVLEPRPLAVDPDVTDPDHPAMPPGLALAPAPGLLDTPDVWPMLQLGESPEGSRTAWAGLPRLPWVAGGQAKPSATVLASAPGREGEGAILAAQPYGLGKVLWVGTDATWRWRFRVGDEIHHRFWGQVVRWAGSDNLAAGNRVVRHGPLKARVEEGEGIKLQARVAEDVVGLPADLLIAARIFRRDSQTEAVAVVPLRPVPGQPRVFEGAAPGLPEGPYVVRLDAPQLVTISENLGAGPIPEAPLEVIPRDTSERVELAASRDPLERLAAATGGKVFTEQEAANLPALLKARSKPVERTEETPLWDHPGTLILFFTILTAEWILRKRAGLP
ncbi:hypothetical protein P12x_000071 [Tundrisphaera lichenicola]|uniref:hypothetical protein n=1 Tax=Tundrisphaera lichenicola TaxID=2029860 RepID=UPI003EC0B844